MVPINKGEDQVEVKRKPGEVEIKIGTAATGPRYSHLKPIDAKRLAYELLIAAETPEP